MGHPPDPLAEEETCQSIFSQIVWSVADIAASQGFELPKSIHLGTYSSRRANSYVIPISVRPNPIYLLAFSRHLNSFVSLFAFFFAEILTRESDLKLRLPSQSEIDLLHNIVTHLIARPLRALHCREGYMRSFRIEADAIQFPSIAPNSESGPLARLIADAMLSFVAGHEIIHLSHALTGPEAVLLRRPGVGTGAHKPATADEGTGSGDTEFPQPLNDRLDEAVLKQELACDVRGSHLSSAFISRMLEKQQGNIRALALCGGPLFLTCLSTFDRAFHARASGPLPAALRGLVHGGYLENSYDSHPSPAYRREAVRLNLQETAENLGKPNATELSFAVDDWAWNLLEGYWESSESTHLEEFYGRAAW